MEGRSTSTPTRKAFVVALACRLTSATNRLVGGTSTPRADTLGYQPKGRPFVKGGLDSGGGGETGIRTLGTTRVHTLSKRARSTAPASLREAERTASAW